MKMAPKQFEYLICVDFEATCWEKRAPENAEIIEIGAVLLNLRDEKIESICHTYVKPTHHPILSDYCIKLTGITQNFIDNQATFVVAYQQFMNWLDELRKTKGLRFTTPNMRNTKDNTNTTFCSWTNWDLSHFFRLDCQRNALTWPSHLRAWIDARKIFERQYPGRFTFATALQRIGIEQVGNAHSGIDDAKTLAKMMLHLYNNNTNFSRVTDYRKGDT